jgi:hypothetical protein
MNQLLPGGTVYWRTEPEKTSEYWLELVDPEGWWHAIVKWDGCIHLDRYFNFPLGHADAGGENSDYLHICELDDVILRLQALRDVARAHFGKEWPE